MAGRDIGHWRANLKSGKDRPKVEKLPGTTCSDHEFKRMAERNSLGLHFMPPGVGNWKNGKMIEEYLFWDNQSFMKQIGLAK